MVIEKRLDRIEISNPGTLLLEPEQLWRGGVSECRNPTLQTMFLLVGGGEKAGSGIDKILQGCEAQHWRHQSVEERRRPDCVVLTLPMVSLLPPEAMERLRARFGEDFETMGRDEVLAIVTAEVEGHVSNSRMQQLTDTHPRELTEVLRALVERGFLVPDGRTAARVYRVFVPKETTGPGDLERASDQSGASSQSEASPQDFDISSPPWRMASSTRDLILQVCRDRYMSSAEKASTLDRDHRNLRWRHIKPLVKEGLLEQQYPDRPNHKDQAYRTRRDEP